MVNRWNMIQNTCLGRNHFRNQLPDAVSEGHRPYMLRDEDFVIWQFGGDISPAKPFAALDPIEPPWDDVGLHPTFMVSAHIGAHLSVSGNDICCRTNRKAYTSRAFA